jgi:lysine N6-hydroxylase
VIGLRPLDLDGDLDLVHGWMQTAHVAPWWELGGSRANTRSYLQRESGLAHLEALIADVDGRPFAYVEVYRAAEDPLAAHYDARPGDRGLHLLVGPRELLGSGVPRALVRELLGRLLAEPGTDRVVCEPDVRNARMLGFCRALGGEVQAELELPGKRAALVVWERPLDVIGVGIGPFNLGLAALLEPLGLRSAFFDQRPEFAWHAGLMLPDAEIQVPFLADLVTLADPTSPYSFLNYLHEQGRLYRFYFHERFHVLRREYDAYCRWVAEHLPSCRFGQRALAVEPRPGGGWIVRVEGPDGAIREHAARHVVLGVGGLPHVPECARAALGEEVLHSGDYLAARERLHGLRSICVVGSGQSAAEVFADLLQHAPGARLDWFTRSPGFLPMEYSKLGLEHFTPEYVDHFHALPEALRDELRAGQDLLYKGISGATSDAIYDALYRRSVDGVEPDVRYAANCGLRAVEERPGGVALELVQLHTGERVAHECDAVVLATGYRDAPLPIGDLAALDDRGRPVVERDYRLRLRDGAPSTLFVQNAELHTHGVGTPDLGLGAYRSSVIANAIVGREAYPVRERNVFQSFGAPAPLPLEAL